MIFCKIILFVRILRDRIVSVIVGRGAEALAALGTSDWLSFTAMKGITSAAQGFSVFIA